MSPDRRDGKCAVLYPPSMTPLSAAPTGRLRPAMKVLDVGVGRCLEFRRRALEINPPLFQIGDAVRDLERAFHVVRDHQRRDRKAFLQPADQLINAVADHRVQARRRLVVEDALGTADDGPCERDAFFHAAAQVDGHFLLVAVQADHVQGLAHRLGNVPGVALTAFPQREGDVFLDAHGIEQRAVLKKDADLAPDRAEATLAETSNVTALDENLARVRVEQPDEVFEQDAFPTAAAADDDEGLAGGQRQVDAAQDLVSAEAFDQTADFQKRAHVRLPASHGKNRVEQHRQEKI